mgnify:CR=1 FL=1|jgi:oligoribonuclease NrnB/cAMP/cGMP phosphodiesterase (DHH superfamily)
MPKVRELLDKMEAEILAEVNAIAVQEDAEIKKYAQDAYDNAVKEKIADIKKRVEVKYETAKSYLMELLEDEPEVKEEATVEAANVETAPESEVEATIAVEDNGPVVLG